MIYQFQTVRQSKYLCDSEGTLDRVGNLTSVTDTRNGLTHFGYDTMDRETSRIDALNQTETFSYDLDDNLTGHTDRKSQSQVLSYDALNRLTNVTYKMTGGSTESTAAYSYDAGNRVTSVNDSVGGTLTEGYDGLDRLTSETSPKGSVSYQYDAASRRTQMTVAGQSAVNYGYDNADRLTGITQGGSSVAIGYDNANRRTTLTLPNGIQLTYGYDNANQLTGLTYKLGGTTVGSLTYGYDNDGRIVNRGGTFDVTNLPAALASASYDANNRLTNWGGTTLSYDADGNLTGNSTNTYTWNTRNQLTGISGGTTASFLYDALGRRESKTISSTSTNFLYDGLNMEQELNGTTPTVNYLTGAGIDETLSRKDSSGTQSYLTDNLGSTLALTTSAGAIATSYSYEPYGNTTASGTSSTNALQYTGRENDGDSLYYNRARYYSPVYGRFISEDPLSELGGPGAYAYAAGDPMDFYDPLGLYPLGYYLPSIPQPVVNFSAGLGDALLLGLGPSLRNALGVYGGVDRCSTAYEVGGWTSFAFGVGRLGYAGLAKGFSLAASSGVAASAFRSQLKYMFSLGTTESWRVPNLAQYTTDAAFRAAAGRTNILANLYGTGIAVAGAAGGIGTNCGCN